MNRSVKLRWSSLQVGALVIVVSAILLWSSFTGGGTSIFESKKEFTCFFRNVDGLLQGSPVWMAGVEVGNVRSLKFVNMDSLAQVEVVCAVKSSIWSRMTPQAEVLLGSIGFLGDKYIEIIPGLDEIPPIPEGGIIKTRDAGEAKAVFKEAEIAAENLGSMIGGFDSLLARMNRGEGTLGKLATEDQLYVQMASLTANLARLTADMQANQERVVSSVEELANSVSGLAEQVNNNSGTLGKIMNDPALYDNLTLTSARLDSVMTKINAAEGSLGLLVSDTALYIETTKLITRVSNLVSDIERNPRKYFKFSVF